MSILNLDDLLSQDPEFQLADKIYHLNVSFKSVISFKKWHEQPEDEINMEELIKIIVKEHEDFNLVFSNLNVASQIKIGQKLMEMWSEYINPDGQTKDAKKK